MRRPIPRLKPAPRPVLLLAVAALVAAACSGSEADPTTAAPALSTTTSESPPAAPPDFSFGWTRLDLPDSPDFDAVPLAMIDTGRALVAVGVDARDWAAVFISEDGAGFRRVDDSPVFEGAVMEAVTEGGPGLVAVGSTASGGRFTGSSDRAVVWTSDDGGESWSRVDQEGFAGAGMKAVAAGGPGLVAVGSDGENGVVWTSETGDEWTRVDDEGGVFAGTLPSAVIRGGAGLVMVGATAEFDGVAWTSTDGLTWARIPAGAGIFRGSPIWDVAEHRGNVVAVGQTLRENGAAVWVSEDGARWERVPLDIELAGAAMLGLAAGPDGLLAFGIDTTDTTSVWSSPEGVEWRTVPDDPTVFGDHGFIRAAAFGASGVVVVGDDVGTMVGWAWSR